MDLGMKSMYGFRMSKNWNVLRPNSQEPTPMYLQLAHKLAEAINAGRWHAGEALPSERVLSEKLGVSRVTARKALDELVDQQLIARRQGSGTFIAPRLEEPLSRLTSFTEMLTAKGWEPSSKWLERKIDVPTHEEMLRLGLSPSSQVARLERLRLADSVVMAVESSTLPLQYLPDPSAVTHSLYAFLDQSGNRVVRALQHFRAVNASKRIAKLANINQGEAMLLLTRIGFNEQNVAIELTNTYCRNDYYDFVAELRR
jgi:GntR family transcriptional regulator